MGLIGFPLFKPLGPPHWSLGLFIGAYWGFYRPYDPCSIEAPKAGWRQGSTVLAPCYGTKVCIKDPCPQGLPEALDRNSVEAHYKEEIERATYSKVDASADLDKAGCPFAASLAASMHRRYREH